MKNTFRNTQKTILSLTFIALFFCFSNSAKGYTINNFTQSYSNNNLNISFKIENGGSFSITNLNYHPINNINDTFKIEVCLNTIPISVVTTKDVNLQVGTSSVTPNHYIIVLKTADCSNILLTQYYPSTITGVVENSSKNSVTIYPNPTHNVINIDINNSLTINSLALYDITGRIVKSFQPSQRKLNLSYFDRGQYFLKIETENGVITKKVMIE